MIATNANIPMLDRPAIRFLMSRKDGRLETYELGSTRVHATHVVYQSEPNGTFRVRLPLDDDHARAIREGGFTTLTVYDPSGPHPRLPLRDADGLPTINAIAHVSVLTETRHEAHGDELLVALRICDLQVYLHAEKATA